MGTILGSRNDILGTILLGMILGTILGTILGMMLSSEVRTILNSTNSTLVLSFQDQDYY